MRKKFLSGLLAVAMLNILWSNTGFTTHAQTVSANNNVPSLSVEDDFVPGNVIVSVKKGIDASGIFKGVNAKSVNLLDEGLKRDENGELVDSDSPKIYLLTLEDKTEQAVLDTVKALQTIDGVVSAQPDNFVKVEDTGYNKVNDPLFNSVYGIHHVNAPVAWNVTQGEGVTVAIIDSGIDYNHPDLKDNMWVNEKEIPGNGIDDDGNGYIDDIHGCNTCVKRDSELSGDPMDDLYHGTHVAGIVGASLNNEEGVVGVAPKVKLAALKFIDWTGIGTTSNAISCMTYAMEQGFKLINASWTIPVDHPGNPTLFGKVRDCGALFVASAGNGGDDNDKEEHLPSNWKKYLDNVVVVAATDEQKNLANNERCHSNYGATMVDLAAPGDMILSTMPSHDPKAPYYYLCGTSMSSPYVTGTAALILSLHPEYTIAQVKKAILDSVDRSQKLAGKMVTGGMLNTARALGVVTTYQGVDYKDVFDYDTYKSSYQDAYAASQKSPVEALQHFVEVGMKDGRPASDEFDPRAYRARYKDLDEKFGNDWTSYYMHYINEGKAEGRVGTSEFTPGDLTKDGEIDDNDLHAMTNAMRAYSVSKSEGNRCYDAVADMDFDLDIDHDDYVALEKIVNLKQPVTLLGDVNSDGVVDINDYSTLRKYISNSYGYRANADIDRDGDNDSEDLELLKSMI